MISLIRDRNYEQLDWDNLLEELESMGKNEQRELESRLIVLLMHLLKFQYQPSHRSKSWQNTIRNQRTEIGLLLGSVVNLWNNSK
jgi:ketopantoate reductase